MSNALKQAMANQRELTPYEKFRNKLMAIKPELQPLVGNNVDRFVRVALNAVQANPALLEADGRSLLNSCMKAAQDGLLPDGREAVFNIYRTKIKQQDGSERWVPIVQYLPMVGGLIKKLYDSGAVTFVDGVAVYERDTFDYQRGDDPKIIHKPYGGAEDPGSIVAAYAIVKLTNGETKREVMWKRDLDKVRKAAKTDKGWSEWEDQFSIKSVLKRIYKQLPSNVEIDNVVASDNTAMGFTADTDITLLPEQAGGEAAPAMPIKTAEKEPVKTGEVVDNDTGEIHNKGAAAGQEEDPPVPIADLYSTRLMTCKDIDLLDVIAGDVRSDTRVSEEDRATLNKLYLDRKTQLSAPQPGAKKR